jgi:O-acetyl-ADP-ribose deacetylase (regulator of RNase III)
MTIEFVKGDLFESGCEALVCPVNCVGVMGKGLALQFKQKYPDYFENYQLKCRIKLAAPGRCIFYIPDRSQTVRLILSFFTKDHWKDKSKLEWVEHGLDQLIYSLLLFRIKSVAVPALGCGEGGLSFSEVKPLMVEAFEKWPDVLFKIYEPLEQ